MPRRAASRRHDDCRPGRCSGRRPGHSCGAEAAGHRTHRHRARGHPSTDAHRADGGRCATDPSVAQDSRGGRRATDPRGHRAHSAERRRAAPYAGYTRHAKGDAAADFRRRP